MPLFWVCYFINRQRHRISLLSAWTALFWPLHVPPEDHQTPTVIPAGREKKEEFRDSNKFTFYPQLSLCSNLHCEISSFRRAEGNSPPNHMATSGHCTHLHSLWQVSLDDCVCCKSRDYRTESKGSKRGRKLGGRKGRKREHKMKHIENPLPCGATGALQAAFHLTQREICCPQPAHSFWLNSFSQEDVSRV